jgi:hypothetical protein
MMDMMDVSGLINFMFHILNLFVGKHGVICLVE